MSRCQDPGNDSSASSRAAAARSRDRTSAGTSRSSKGYRLVCRRRMAGRSRARAALPAVAFHCTVHNTLQEPPEIRLELES
ncbi:hypothetical protein GCM10017771_78460 [Streptomyces capitiformicae]|uniref:Uncharacterized protein n=1 Tax=Streptomyces capitiformicae TaxID=2014920 RepID=A0A918ZJ76_9ACTN|nr:hypothetical protein GCM10017771_78460 [Streptomyces capitiformicae]